MNRFFVRNGKLLLAACLLVVPAYSRAEEPSQHQLVDSIIALRTEVEDLEARLRSLKSDHGTRMSALVREEGQLAAERERQQLRLKKIEQQLARQKQAAQEEGVEGETLRPVVLEALDAVENYVETSLPFRREDRLASVRTVRSELESGVLEPSRALNALWSFVADEIRMTGEAGLFRQPIRIDDEDKLADVARLGMLQLYFRTDDGRVGLWTEDGFRYVEGEDRERILAWMSSLRKNVRFGYFELPQPVRTSEK